MMKLGLICLLSCVSVVNVTDPEAVCSSKPVEAVYDQDVTLQCHLEPPMDATAMKVEWCHFNCTVHLYLDSKDNPAEQKENFEGRTSLSRDGLTRGNLSLKLSSVRPSDTGRYRCSFETDKLQSSCYVNLTVGESDVIGSHEPIEVTKGDDAILPCHLEPPFDVKNLTVEWKRNGTKVHRYRSRKDDLVDQDEHFKGRTFLFHDEMAKGNISLKLTNVNERDEGNYTCFVPKLHSQVKRGKVTLKVNLTVAEPVDRSNKGNQNSDTDAEGPTGISTGGIIAIVVVVVGAIAGVCVVIWWIRKRNAPCAGRDESGPPNMDGQQQLNHEAIPLNNIGNDNN